MLNANIFPDEEIGKSRPTSALPLSPNLSVQLFQWDIVLLLKKKKPVFLKFFGLL